MNRSHWLRGLDDATDPLRCADELIAARTLVAFLAERGRERRVERGSHHRLTHIYEDATITGYGEPFTDEIVDARLARTRGLVVERWDIDHVADHLGFDLGQRDLLRSSRDVMVQVHATFRVDPRTMTWADLRRLPPAELYVLLEQAGNPDRPVRNPIAHAYRGHPDYHPYIGHGRVKVLRSRDGVATICSNAAAGGDLAPVGLVVHPQSESRLRVPGLEPHLDLLPTTSVRTLYDPDEDRHHKLSFDAQITSHTRLLTRAEAANAIAATNLLCAVNERGLMPPGLYFLPELAWASHRSSRFANCLLRGGFRHSVPALPEGARLVPMSSFTTPLSFARGRSFFELMCRRTTPAHLFTQLVNALVAGHLGLLDLGISHETHAQNTLLVLDLDQPVVHGICLRDVEAMKIDPDRHHQLGLPLFHPLHGGTAATRSQALLDPHRPELRRYLATAAFTHGIIDSQISRLAAVVLETGLMDLGDVIAITGRAITGHQDRLAYAKDTLLPTFYRRNLAHKGLGVPIVEPYRAVHNLLYP